MRYTSAYPRTFHNRITNVHRGPRRGRADRDTGAAECVQAQTRHRSRWPRIMSTVSLQVDGVDRTPPATGFNRWIVTFTEPETGDKLMMSSGATTKAPNESRI